VRVNDDLVVLELPLGEWIMNLSVILDAEKGATLVDTGLPGQAEMILEKLEAAGISRSDLKRILITHQDVDHIGSLKALKEATGAEVLALDVEIPYIDGTLPGYKIPPPERLEQNPGFKAMLDALERCPVDVALKDGEVLDLAGGVTVGATPGHTLGHISLYLNRTQTLITGDALTSSEGTLGGPMEQATPDMASAKASIKKIAELDVKQIVAYHGGIVDQDSNGQLRRVADE
jgi:glyoxylase-like metal-dependent hydrolase (beta-lactamase superfamily II)